MSRDLATATWLDLGSVDHLVVVPVGSVEQHGPHLPFDTDTRVAVAAAERAVEALGVTAVLAPPVTYGASGEHESFPGTISIGQDALHLLLIELGRSASRWARRIAFVNGHGGNASPLVEAVARLRYEGRDAGWFPCTFRSGDAHAGETETSILLALDGAVVRSDRLAPGAVEPVERLIDRMRQGGIAAVSESGVLGDPTRATAAGGEALLADLVDRLIGALTRWWVEDSGRLR